jgi:TRAP transporter 4TM/12TM fusion protein
MGLAGNGQQRQGTSPYPTKTCYLFSNSPNPWRKILHIGDRMDRDGISSFRKYAILAISAAWLLLQLWWAALGFPGVILVRPLHLAFAMALVFLAYPIRLRNPKLKVFEYLLNGVPLCLIALSAVHYMVDYNRILTRWAMFHSMTILDKIVGVTMILLLFEAGRRVIGAFLSIFAFLFVLYGVLGPFLPDFLAHHGLSLLHMLDLQSMTDFGMYGVALGVSVVFVYYFVIFASYLNAVGGDRLLTDVALATAGRSWGGAAKAAVVGSSLVGTISGSAAANVVTTGTITIPLMKRAGFSPEFAGAVEAAASTGGQIMPPIMGSAAFLMAYLLGKPYWDIAIAAIIPAVLYYAFIFMVVHFYSIRRGIRPLRADEMPDAKKTALQYGHLLIPLVLLVVQIAQLVTLTMSAFRALMALFAVSFFRKATRFTWIRFLEATEAGARSAALVAIACALAGIVIGVVDYSGLGIKVTSSIVRVSEIHVALGLLIIMIVVLVLGMGMPTDGAYLSAAILLAPSMVKLGYSALVSHMFIFYFSVISMVTPPVAISAYAAAGIAGSNITRTGWIAFLLCLPGFLVPFLFLRFPSLIHHNSIGEMVMVLLPILGGMGILTYFGPRLLKTAKPLPKV